MNNVTAIVTLDQLAGTIKFALDLQGDSPLDHEILAAAIGNGRELKIVPTHKGDELFAEIVITDPMIWPRAIRALKNRTRVTNGEPTIEEENYRRVEQGQPTIEDEELDQAEAAHEQENNRRISAGLPTIEQEEESRYRAQFDEDNRQRAGRGIPQLSDDDFHRAVDERIKTRDDAMRATHEANVQADREYRDRRKSIRKHEPRPIDGRTPGNLEGEHVDDNLKTAEQLDAEKRHEEEHAEADTRRAQAHESDARAKTEGDARRKRLNDASRLNDAQRNTAGEPAYTTAAEKTQDKDAAEDLISDVSSQNQPTAQSMKEASDRDKAAKADEATKPATDWPLKNKTKS